MADFSFLDNVVDFSFGNIRLFPLKSGKEVCVSASGTGRLAWLSPCPAVSEKKRALRAEKDGNRRERNIFTVLFVFYLHQFN